MNGGKVCSMNVGGEWRWDGMAREFVGLVCFCRSFKRVYDTHGCILGV